MSEWSEAKKKKEKRNLHSQSMCWNLEPSQNKRSTVLSAEARKLKRQSAHKVPIIYTHTLDT